MIGGIGIILGLEGDALALLVHRAALAGLVGDIVGGVDLHAGQIRVDLHGNVGLIGCQLGHLGQLAAVVQAPVVVIAVAEDQGLEVLTDVPAHFLPGAEVHGRALHRGDLAGGDGVGIGGGVEIGIHPDGVLQDGTGVMAVQVEVAVVGVVDDGIRLGDAVVVDADGVVLGQGVGDVHIQRAGVALVAVGAVDGEGDGILAHGLDVPDPEGLEIQTGVEIIGAVVDIELILHAVQHKMAAGDAVGVAAHGGAEEGAAGGGYKSIFES